MATLRDTPELCSGEAHYTDLPGMQLKNLRRGIILTTTNRRFRDARFTGEGGKRERKTAVFSLFLCNLCGFCG
jgi:hypothetical protein